MATENQVYEAADALQKAGKRVSQTTCIDWLQRHPRYRGASPRDLGPHLKKWKQKRNYHRVIETAGLPEAVQGVFNKAVADLWHEAKKAAGVDIADNRQELEATQDDLVAANAQIETLQKRVEQLELDNGRLRRENAIKIGELDQLEEKLRTVRAREFWDRVMRELRTLMPHGRWMSVSEIEPLVPRGLANEAENHREEWNTATLRKKLDQRVYHDKYFEKEEGKRRYRRKPEAAEAA
ncbi:DNA-binding protein [Micromonospora sp. STR1s_5]|nr:DNA-binding protein [Micromonospora sp. STR1s_5]